MGRCMPREPQTRRRCSRSTDRQHRLRGRLATAMLGGSEYPQWEYEVTAGGRVRYLVDETRRTVHLVYSATRHPRDTDS